MPSPRETIIKGAVEESSLEWLLQQREKRLSEIAEQSIKEELSKRRRCPECGNTMMKDEKKSEYYCPLGHFSFEI